MAITVVFDVPGMTAGQYDSVMARLAEASESSPDGRIHHIASPKEDGWLVVDVWESPQALDRFAAKLIPLLVEEGVTPPEPKVLETHNLAS